jgi:hypothetical protein
MSSWQLSYYSGVSWSSYYDISNPTNEPVQAYTSNRQKYKLYDGTTARTIPNGSKVTLEEIELLFENVPEDDNLLIDDSPKRSLKKLITDGSKVRLKTHLEDGSSKRLVWEGYFVDINNLWNVGLYPIDGDFKTLYDISCTFDIISESYV